jgi:hypothetical protein
LFEHAGIRLSTFMPGNVVWAKDKFSLVDETTAIKDRDKGRTSALCVCPYVLASEVSDHILRGGGGGKGHVFRCKGNKVLQYYRARPSQGS